MKLDAKLIKRKTEYAKMSFRSLKKNLERFEQDQDKDSRKSECLCKTCFYLKGGMAGQAFTKYTCANCEKEQMHHNTNTPKYCNTCANAHNCCTYCACEL